MIRYLIRQARGTDQNPPAPTRRERRRQQRDVNAYPPNQQYVNQSQGYQQNALNDPNVPAYGAVQPEQSFQEKLKVWLPRLRLVAAVFLPVILETLDYTGTYSSAFLIQLNLTIL
jgi:hypothetical protein